MRLFNIPSYLTTTTLLICSINISFANALPDSATVMEFDDNNTLFVADSDSGKILAYTLPKSKPSTSSVSYNLKNIGDRIGKLLNVDSRQLSYHDVEVHPISKEAYVSVSVRQGHDRNPVIVKINQKGNVERLDLGSLKHTTKQLIKTASDNVRFWRDIPATTLRITDLDYVDGSLYVSGLSNGEFASTLRKLSYPFDESSSITSVEIYHTVHNQTETRAPIRAMTVLDLDGVETIVAAYTCTPLVTIATEKLNDGAHVKGKTIAELGYGNTPLDVINFSAFNQEQQKMEDFVLVVHKERSADLIRVEDLIQAEKQEGLSSPEMWAKAGVPTRPIPLAGVLQAADQDAQYIVTLKRDLSTGNVDLVSFRKGAYFRLSDFISEYNFPDYRYSTEQEMYRTFQNLLKTDAGFSDLVRDKDKPRTKQ